MSTEAPTLIKRSSIVLNGKPDLGVEVAFKIETLVDCRLIQSDETTNLIKMLKDAK